MKRIFLPSLIFIIIFLNFIIPVHAGLMSSEGSLELRAMQNKMVCGIACVFSVYENPSTYKFEISGNLNKFVEKIEPNTFTLTGIQCPGESEARRTCIAKLCNDPQSTSTKMPCIYFSAPLEFSFDFCNGLPCWSQMHTYEGAIKVIGSIGAAQTVEPLSFFVYYYPFSGWLIVIVAIILIPIIVFFVRRKMKKRQNL